MLWPECNWHPIGLTDIIRFFLPPPPTCSDECLRKGGWLCLPWWAVTATGYRLKTSVLYRGMTSAQALGDISLGMVMAAPGTW